MSTNFNFSFGSLTQRGDRIDTLLQRDAEEFSGMGYDEEYRLGLKIKVDFFRDLPSDQYWEGQQMLRTDAKKKLLASLTDQLGNLRFRAKLALGEKSVEYRSLRFAKLQTMKEQDLLIYANHVCTTCRNMIDKLAKRSITEEMLVSIEETATGLDDAIDQQRMMISTREAKTFEREEKANEIYAIIAEVCEVGKKIWDGVNPAHYNDYVIYGSKDTIPEDEP